MLFALYWLADQVPKLNGAVRVAVAVQNTVSPELPDGHTWSYRV